MKYLLLYFDDEHGGICKQKTNSYAIYLLNEDKTKMQCFYQVYNSKITKYEYSERHWFDYKNPKKLGKFITQDDLFILCL